MTNASIKSSFGVFLGVTLAIALSMGVSVSVAHAQYDDGSLGYADFSGDNLGYADFGGSNLGYSDTYGDNLGYGDFYGDNLGYSDSYGDNLGYGDNYGDNLGYGDYSGDNLGYGDYYGDNLGYGDYGTDVTGTDITGTDVTYENGIGYSYTPSFGATTFGASYGSGFSFPSMPISFNAPSYRPISYPAPILPAPVHPTPVVTTPVTNNNCVNNSCNTTNVNNNTNTNTNIINSGNTTVTPVVAQPIVQYVQPQPQPTYYAQPSCTISITNYNGNNYGPNAYNQLATITWSSTNAMNGVISPNVGSVSGWGSMQVYPTNGQVYTMTVYGQGGSATCSTQPFYTYVAPQVPQTPYVSLSQIPYTGFDFGTLGNSIYWLSLIVFAGSAAYLVLYFNGGALAMISGNRTRAQIAMPKITVSKAPAAVAVAKTEAPVVSPIQFSAPASRNTADTMHVTHSKGGSMPRIHISRE